MRHTHFEFAWVDPSANGQLTFARFNDFIAQDIPQYKGTNDANGNPIPTQVRVAVVANNGYVLDDYTTAHSFFRDFDVSLEDDVTAFDSATAVYNGFNTEGTLDHSQAAPELAQLSFLDDAGDVIPMESHHVVYQYRVVDSTGHAVDWTGLDGVDHLASANEGWTSQPSADGAGNYYPADLENGQRVQVRLTPAIGYRLIQGAQYTDFSKTYDLPSVAGLRDESTAETFSISSSTSTDYTVTFTGSDGAGGIDSESSQSASFDAWYLNEGTLEVQWLRPLVIQPPDGVDAPVYVTDQGDAKFGLQVFVPDATNPDPSDESQWVTILSVDQTGLTPADFVATTSFADSWTWVGTSLASDVAEFNNPLSSGVQRTLIPSSQFDMSNADHYGLSVFDTLRFVQKADADHGFRWENTLDGIDDVWIPKEYAEHFMGGSATNKIGDLVIDSHGYFAGVQVQGLSIEPGIIIRDSSFDVIYEPTNIHGVRHQYAYQNDVNVDFTQTPGPSDSYYFTYTITDPSGVELFTGTSLNNPGAQRFMVNGNSIKVSYNARAGYTIDPSFDQRPRTILIQGLKTMIDTTSIARPEIEFDGVVGQGSISAVRSTDATRPYHGVDVNNAPQVSQDPLEHLVWEFKVFDRDPSGLSDAQREGIAWSTIPPVGLNPTDWVSMRLVPADDEYGVEPPVSAIDTNAVDARTDMFIPVRTQLESDVLAKFTATTIGSYTNNRFFENNVAAYNEVDVLSRKFVTIEAAKTLDDGSLGEYFDIKSYGNDNDGDGIVDRVIRMGDTFSFRLVEKDATRAYFDQNDANVQQDANGVWFYQLPGWVDNTVDNLKASIHVNDLGFADELELSPQSNTPIAMQIFDKPNGFSEVSAVPINEQVIEDLTYDEFDDSNNIVEVDASALVEMRYRVNTFDEESQTMISSDDWVTTLPTNLENGDHVYARLFVKDENLYSLTGTVQHDWEISGLQTLPQGEFTLAGVGFSGENGSGTAVALSGAETGQRWAYQVQDSDGNIVNDWSITPPTGLSNGDVVRVVPVTYNGDLSTMDDSTAKEFIVSGLDSSETYVSIRDIRAVNDLIDTAQLKEGTTNHNGQVIFEDPQIIEQFAALGFEPMFTVRDENGNIISESLNPPHNLNNGESVTITARPINKEAILSTPVEEKVLKVEGLEDVDAPSKTLSKALYIAGGVLLASTIIGIPAFLLIRKRKRSI